MAWIESHQSLLTHRKTGRLSRKLAISKVTAIGHLHAFWWWCLDNAQDGDLTAIDPEDIADGACWEGDPQDFMEAMVFAGFVDDADGVISVHDWMEFAGKLIDKRKSDALRKREARHVKDAPAPAADPAPEVRPPETPPAQDVLRMSSGCPADGAGTQPNPTVPNRKEKTPPKPPAERGEVRDPMDGFDELWAVYPNKEAKKAAEGAYRRLRPTQALRETLLQAVDRAKESSDKWDRGFVPLLSTWLNGKRWLDEFAPPVTALAVRGRASPRLEPGQSASSAVAGEFLTHLRSVGAH